MTPEQPAGGDPWEAAASAAHDAWRAGEDSEHLWRAALGLCESQDEGDPRRATALSGLAHALAAHGRGSSGNDDQTRDTLDQAIAAWDAADGWAGRITSRITARSSLFHLRLRTKTPDAFAGQEQLRHGRAVGGGRAATLNLQALFLARAGDRSAAEGLLRQALDLRRGWGGWREGGVAVLARNLAGTLDSEKNRQEINELISMAEKIDKDALTMGTGRWQAVASRFTGSERHLEAAVTLAPVRDWR
ncbi:MAG: hypothetical protein RIE31_10350 [Alphaproteobacteria bacterium]